MACHWEDSDVVAQEMYASVSPVFFSTRYFGLMTAMPVAIRTRLFAFALRLLSGPYNTSISFPTAFAVPDRIPLHDICIMNIPTWIPSKVPDLQQFCSLSESRRQGLCCLDVHIGGGHARGLRGSVPELRAIPFTGRHLCFRLRRPLLCAPQLAFSAKRVFGGPNGAEAREKHECYVYKT